MKQILCLLTLFAFLTGCTGTATPVPPTETATPPAQTVPQPSPAPVPEPAPLPEPEPVPEVPEVETPQLPDLPYPAYCWGDTAVARDGTVLLQIPDHRLKLAFDAGSGKPAGILADPVSLSWAGVSDGFYGLDGTPVLTDTAMPQFQCFGDLCWYGIPGEYVVQRLSDGTVLQDGLQRILPAGDYLALQPSYWNDRCILMDRTGETVLELDRGFEVTDVFQNRGSTCLTMANALDGQATLVDTDGKPLLDQFYDEITAVMLGCAIVRDGAASKAIDLDTGEVVFTWDRHFYLLPEGAAAETNLGYILVDRQGNRLDDRLLGSDFWFYDWDQDGLPEYILTTSASDPYTTLVLAPDGSQLAAIPMHMISVKPIDSTKLAYANFIGTNTLYEAHLVDLEAGTDTVLATGETLYVQPIATSGGHMLLCTTDNDSRLFLNDGTPARDDLGPCTYLGGDVFSCEDGLRCLDGTWLYRPE